MVMNKVHKSYKFRLYPNDEQKILLAKHFGHCRFIFNHFLNERKESYLNDKVSLSGYDNMKVLTEMKKSDELKWLKEANSQSLQASIRHLDVAYNRFFNKQSEFPRFKSKYDRQSFTIPQNVLIVDDKLSIPKFKKGIKMKIHRKLEGEILFATVSKDKSGKYFVSVTCEVEHNPYEKTEKQVGIDTGIKDLAILSTGEVYENIKPLKTRLKKVKYQQKQLSKKIKGSNNRNKQRIKLALAHEKVRNVRQDYLQKVSTEIVKNHDIISVEDLAVKNMMKNHKLAQVLSDVALGSFYRMLEYKSKWNDRDFIKIDRFFPSSKTCSNCGWINQELTLSMREWTCDICNEQHDRDLNAAKNILVQGINLLSGCGTQSDVKQKRVEALPIGKSVKPEAHRSSADG